MSVADGLHAAGRLIGGGAALVWDGLAGGRRPPLRVEQIDAPWLEDALAARFPGLRVRGVTPLDTHSGTTTRQRLALDSEGGDGVPATLFVKATPAGTIQRLFALVMGLGVHELRFYRELAGEVPVRVPGLYAAEAGPGARRFVLLLEDLAAGGAEFVRVGERVDAGRAAAVVDALARLHAAFWESPRFDGDLAWVRSLENRRRDMALERSLSAQGLAAARRRLGAEMPESFHAACRLLTTRRDAIEGVWAEGPRTLVHGDCHVGNLFFEGEEVGFLDWQVLARAPGVRDLAYFLCNSLPTELRRAQQRSLVERYCAALARHGAPELDPDVAFEGLRAFALYCWLSAAFTAGAGGGLQAEVIARAGLERAQRALEDLGTLELFAERGIR